MVSKWILLTLGSSAVALALYAARVDLPTAAATVAVPDAYAELEGQLRKQPSDARALVLKARMDMQADRFELAAAGFERALALAPKVARDAGVWAEYAEARGMAQGGTLQGAALELVDKALALDPDQAQALDLAGSAAWERRDFATAVKHWKRLLAQIPPGDGRHAELSMAIERAQQRAKFALPSAP